MNSLSTRIARAALMATYWMALLGISQGQVFKILHSFGDGSVNEDGATPVGGLVQAANGNFYGTTNAGGAYNLGTVFEITPQGTTAILHNFGDPSVPNDGSNPQCALILATDGSFYGITTGGGSAGQGTIFVITPQGKLTILHSFGDGSALNPDGTTAPTNAEQGMKTSPLVQGIDGNLYGTTAYNYTTGSNGIFFRMTPQGVVTILNASTGGNSLVQGADGNFYTTLAGRGGPYEDYASESGNRTGGSAVKFTPQGNASSFYSFGNIAFVAPGPFEATYPTTGMVEGSDGNFYGTTAGNISININQIPTFAPGALFKITPQGSVTNLHFFGDGTTAVDGDTPSGALVQGADGNFYGATVRGGSKGLGCLFEITPQGAFTLLHSFGDGSMPNDGTAPEAGLTRGSDGNLYGVTSQGGTAGLGAVFMIAPNAAYLTSTPTVSATVSLPFSYQVTGSILPSSYSATNLPDGLSINPTTGVISGTPMTAQTKTVTLTLFNESIASTVPLVITVVPLPVPTISSFVNSYGSVGANFSYTITASDNSTSFAVGSALPPNLTFDPASGVIRGTPTQAGTFTVPVTATNSTGTSTPLNLSIHIFGTPPTLDEEYNLLHDFGDGTVVNDGTSPGSIFQAFDGNLYGVTSNGGAYGVGAIYQMTPQGNSVNLFYSFNLANGVSHPSSLFQGSDGNFYGIAGTIIFRVSGSGQFISIFHNFGTNTTGFGPTVITCMQASDGNFYGTTSFQGIPRVYQVGSIFKITPQGVLTNLNYFTGDFDYPNNCAEYPVGGLLQAADGTFYGTTEYGGSTIIPNIQETSGYGTLFNFETVGNSGSPGSNSGLPHNFGATPGDGTHPVSTLIQGVDGNIYGTTSGGGTYGFGTIFQYSPSSGAYAVLHSFGDPTVPNDGTNPTFPLIQALDGNFYGTTSTGGGSANAGVIYQMVLTPNGTQPASIKILHTFGGAGDGAGPTSPLFQSTAGNFYGTTGGGSAGGGTIYVVQGNLTATIPPTIIGSTTATAIANTPLFFGFQALNYQPTGAATGAVVKVASTPASTSFFSKALAFVLPGAKSSYTGSQLQTGGLDTWALLTLQNVVTTFPEAMSFNNTTGVTTGQVNLTGANSASPGVYTYHIQASSNGPNGPLTSSQETFTLYVDTAPIATSTVLDDTASVGVAYLYNADVNDYVFTITYSAVNLPGWLTVNTAVGGITGTPPGPGKYVFNPIASNVAGATTLQVNLTVEPINSVDPNAIDPTITSSTTALGNAGVPFSYTITTDSTAPTPSSYSALTLPPGLQFDATSGAISGVPTTAGTFLVPISATNANSTYSSYVNITISPSLVPTVASTLYANTTVGSTFSYPIPATGPVSSYTSDLPANSDLSLNPLTGVISGTPTSAGVRTIHLTVGNVTATSASTLQINVAAPQNYSQWEAGQGFSGPPTDTPHGDGVPNLLKYVYDIHPNTTMSSADRANLPALASTTPIFPR